ncbi:hypothetical protein D3871_27545 [Noviherbaspirillum saxi]|uniref:Uncharacterized protein n=1 Tax=Noviherbaspirillum saxi TaxID=2320863 RepID=A0A3A3FZ69_9BURK|nr:hypothetical protein D3871_27545 [Noviherbaspirillum saxi]
MPQAGLHIPGQTVVRDAGTFSMALQQDASHLFASPEMQLAFSSTAAPMEIATPVVQADGETLGWDFPDAVDGVGGAGFLLFGGPAPVLQETLFDASVTAVQDFILQDASHPFVGFEMHPTFSSAAAAWPVAQQQNHVEATATPKHALTSESARHANDGEQGSWMDLVNYEVPISSGSGSNTVSQKRRKLPSDLSEESSALMPDTRLTPKHKRKDVADPNNWLVAATTRTIKKLDKIPVATMRALGVSLKNNFASQWKTMRSAHLIQVPDLTPEQKKQNAFWEQWRLPQEQRVLAALFQGIYQSSKDRGVAINANNTEQLLALSRTISDQEIEGDTTLGYFLNEELTLQFKAKETTRLFESAVSGIKALTGQDLEADQMWKHCVNPELVDDVIKAGVDPDNPLLRYISNSPEEPYLFNMAKGWNAIVDACREKKPLSADFLITLHAVCTGTGAEDETYFMDLVDNQNTCSLIEGSNMTPEGRTFLFQNIPDFVDTYDIDFEFKVSKDKDYGKLAFDLTRPHVNPARLKEVLEALVVEHRTTDEAIANGSRSAEEKATARTMNDFGLARKLTQFRIFPDGNTKVGHLLLNFLRLQRGELPASLVNHDALDCHSDAQLLAQFKEQTI